MWTALERYQPFAEQHGFGDAWQKMIKERTQEAAWAAADAAWAAAYAAARAEEAAEAAEEARAAEAEKDLRKVNAELLEALKTALHASWDGPMPDYARDKACAAIANAEGVK
jgi:hypothetical protein